MEVLERGVGGGEYPFSLDGLIMFYVCMLKSVCLWSSNCYDVWLNDKKTNEIETT